MMLVIFIFKPLKAYNEEYFMSANENKYISNYVHFFPITTRWMDNDIFGHINNVNYYSYFDTVVNQFLIEKADFKPQTSEQIGFMVESSCQYFSPISYPEKLIGAVRVNRLGNSSVEYGVAIFKEDDDVASAAGRMTHVFVERRTQKPTPINKTLRVVMEKSMIDVCDKESIKKVGKDD
jgi:acyl-CoA thioester hydrolase